MSVKIPQTLYWQDDALVILDQTALPHKVIYERQIDIAQMWHSIHSLKVRGAPAIGVAAAYGSLTGLHTKLDLPLDEFKKEFLRQAEYLNSSRPTAVNLGRSIAILLDCIQNTSTTDVPELYRELLLMAKQIHNEDIDICRKIGEYGAILIGNESTVHTHCNAGALATSGIGTALAPMYVAHENGVKFKVYADETRPLLQGARLTAWELQHSGIDVTLICDNMAADLMSKKLIDVVIVGCDRVAANGDTANKIGTLGVAILAAHYKIPFYVACPSSTMDFACKTGKEIPIEIREGDEVRSFQCAESSEPDVKVYNPAFDITPGELVTGFITEKGIIKPPYNQNLLRL